MNRFKNTEFEDKYYLCLDNIILMNKNKSLNFTFNYDLDKIKLEYIPNERLYKINLNPDTTTLDDLKTWIAIKYNDDGSAKRYDDGILIKNVKELKEGTYYLYRPLNVNGFKIAMTKEGFLKSLSQYIIAKAEYLSGVFQEYLKEVVVGEDDQNICIVVPEGTDIDEYVLKVNSYNKFYIMEASEDAVIANLQAYQTTNDHKVNVISQTATPLKEEHLFLDASDYITALINRLKDDYPEVQFFNIEQDRDENHYKEHVKYIAHLESTTGVIHNNIIMYDPVYGMMQMSTVSMDFEYSCYDIPQFEKRRFDFYNGRFISDVVFNQIQIPETNRKYNYCVIWDRSTPGADALPQKNTALSQTNQSKLSFQFTNRMIITTLRMSKNYPKILVKILQNTKFLKLDQQVPRTKAEMEALK